MRPFILPILFLMFLFIGCKPQSETILIATSETNISETEIVLAIESAFGSVERDASGKIICVDLAKERTSATDGVLRMALALPNLKRFRLAGSSTTPEVFAEIMKQESLEELYLQDLSVNDEELASALAPLSKLKRLALRRLMKISTLPNLPSLRNLALIEMNITELMLQPIFERKYLTALDLRNSSGLTSNDYRHLKLLNKLVDLKIGGFAVNDEVLEAITPIPNLIGLTIDDAFMTPDGFAKFVSNSPSATTLETLVLNRNTSIMDDALLSLKKIPRLKRLTVCGMMILGNFLTQLAENNTSRPKLEQLSLRKTLLMSEEAESLKKYSELRILNLSGIGLSKETAEIVASLQSLEELNVQDCSLDDEIVAIFQEMKSLKKLIR